MEEELVVECRSDHEYAGRPRAFRWRGVDRVVVGILRYWRSPRGKHFQVLTEDDRMFELFYDEGLDHWVVIEK